MSDTDVPLQNPDDEREVALDEEPELDAPPTLDGNERIELQDDDLDELKGDGPEL